MFGLDMITDAELRAIFVLFFPLAIALSFFQYRGDRNVIPLRILIGTSTALLICFLIYEAIRLNKFLL